LPTSLTTEVEESVNVQIDKNYFGNWVECEIGLSIDSFSTVSLLAPFERDRREFRDLFRPFKYQDLEVDTHLETLFHGFIVQVAPKLLPNESSVQVSGYARPGVFCDCTQPHTTSSDAIPHHREFKKLGLKAIAEELCKPFGIEVDFAGPEGKPFDKVRITPEKKIFEFLSELAKQRNLVISNTVEGKLLFWQSVEPGNPVARFVQGESPLGAVETEFRPQEYFSQVTGFATKKRGKTPAKWTEQNPWLASPLRPHIFKLEDTERGDAPEATRAKLGRMFANMVSYTIPDIPSWRDKQGNLWRPNTTVTLYAPDAMVYTETELLIRSVKLKTTRDATTATLELCLPGAFNGKVPEFLPWNES
jgi:prophage tail gpP-like protein